LGKINEASDKTPEGIEVDLGGWLAEQPQVQLAAWIPAPVDRRLDQLVDLLHERARALGNVNQSELVAALLKAAPSDADDLTPVIVSYREAKAHQALLDQTETEGRAILPRRLRGRPKRRS
jgi:hypothetical protein